MNDTDFAGRTIPGGEEPHVWIDGSGPGVNAPCYCPRGEDHETVPADSVRAQHRIYPDGMAAGRVEQCGCAIGMDHSRQAPGSTGRFWAQGGQVSERVTEKWLTRPRGEEKAAEQAAMAFESFTGNVHLRYVQQTEAQLKDVVRAALKLVEENPRHEPMQASISRPAVERMLAEDLKQYFPGTEPQEIATALFDAGWRPTIDRVVR